MALSQSTLTSSATAVYTSSGQSAVITMYLCNFTGSDTTVTIHLVPSGGSPGNGNLIYKTVPLAASDTYIIDAERLILADGDSIQALAAASNSVAMTVIHMGA